MTLSKIEFIFLFTKNIPIEKAKLFTSFTLTAMLIGYVLGIILIPKIISQQKALRFSAIMGIAFSMAAIFTDGYVSVFFIAILGLANAIVWPAIWPLAIDKLGKFTHTGAWSGIIPRLEKYHKTTHSEYKRRELQKFMKITMYLLPRFLAA